MKTKEKKATITYELKEFKDEGEIPLREALSSDNAKELSEMMFEAIRESKTFAGALRYMVFNVDSVNDLIVAVLAIEKLYNVVGSGLNKKDNKDNDSE